MAGARDPQPEVSCRAGTIRGRDVGGVRRFLGIPFAEPPVGRLRWMPPRRLGALRDTFEATVFGAACIQNKPQISKTYTLPAHIAFSEDCLTLNIWSPQDADNAPVIVWIHGGSLVIGASSEPMYDGAGLARRGLVVVTVNYRLGVLGWLAHPDLSAEQGGTSGNYGLRDQICALEWVRDNIAAFGGDPDNVTLAGQSAGALSAAHLMAAPAARGLFHKVIAQSPYLFSMPDLKGPVHGSASAEGLGRDFATAMGAPDLASLRAMDARDLVLGATRWGFRTSSVVDGTLIPDQLVSILDAGAQAPVPVLTGFTEGEIRSLRSLASDTPDSAETYVREIRHRHGEGADRFLALYPPTDMEESIIGVTRDALYLFGSRRLAEAQEAVGAPAFHYLWDHSYPAADALGQRAFHGSEVPFVFGQLAQTGPCWPPIADTDEQRSMSNLVGDLWASFARSGQPETRSGLAWPRYSRDQSSLRLSVPLRVESDLLSERYRLMREEFDRRRESGLAWNWNVGLLQPPR